MTGKESDQIVRRRGRKVSWFRRKSPEERRAIRERKEQKEIAEAEAWLLHKQRLEKAAGISSVTLTCHGDTWAFIHQTTGQNRNFTKPEAAQQPDGLVTVSLSGPSLVAVLESMWWTKKKEHLHGGTVAIAKRIYDVAAATVDAVDPGVQKKMPIPPIVIDDRLGTVDPHV